jgi:hypothetical protein
MENDKKITAVEWLRKEIILNSKHKESSKGRISFEIGLSKFDELFIQANKIEEQQILDAYHVGYGCMLRVPTKDYNPEQYYDETFKKK